MTATATPSRNAGLDALRAALTVLVLFHHTAITYGAIGGWFYREVPTDGRFETKLLVFFCTINQAFFMGLFFLIAGYFTPGAVARKGVAGFVRDRLLRLGVPLLVFGFVIGPATIALAATVRGQSFGATLQSLWERGVFENGPLWFAQALLVFSIVPLIWQRWPVRPFPSNLALMAAALAVGLAAFALRLVWPVGVNVFGLQLGYFASYVVLFAAGCAGASGQWLVHVPHRQRAFWRRIARLALLVLPAVVLAAPFVPFLHGDTAGGMNLQAVVYAVWEPLVAWGIILSLLHRFGRHDFGPIWRMLAQRAFAIFIIHPPVLVAIALAWRDISAPHLVKFAVTGTATCLACYWLAGLLLRVPAIRRIV